MKRLFFILIICCRLNGFGQDFLLKNRSDVKFDFECLANDSSDFNNPPWSFNETKETIIATMTNSNKFEATFFFRYVSDEYIREKLCDSIVIKYYCKECSDENLNQILNSHNKWRKVNDNYFITKSKFVAFLVGYGGAKYRCGVMRKVPVEDNNVVMKLQISLVDFEREEWKKSIKRSKKLK